MTTLYLVSNNCVLNNLAYKSDESLELKREKRPLSIEGEQKAKMLAEFEELQDINVIYSSGYASALATTKYLADKLELTINVENKLNERKIGLLEDKTLRFFKEHQEHDFNYRLSGGESINSTKTRITNAINDILKDNEDLNILVATHSVAITSYLLNYCETGYNLDERLILNYKNNVIVDGTTNGVDIYKIIVDNNKIIDIEKL
ncbi:MAG: histidine phosphatase family protein [Bacilli bacterium]|nr:histidine phosphatase family protein [Bacilli bacterium]